MSPGGRTRSGAPLYGGGNGTREGSLPPRDVVYYNSCVLSTKGAVLLWVATKGAHDRKSVPVSEWGTNLGPRTP